MIVFSGIIKFDSRKSRDDAIEYLNGTTLKGSVLNLEECLAINVKRATKYFVDPEKEKRKEREGLKRKSQTSKYTLLSYLCDLARHFYA